MQHCTRGQINPSQMSVIEIILLKVFTDYSVTGGNPNNLLAEDWILKIKKKRKLGHRLIQLL